MKFVTVHFHISLRDEKNNRENRRHLIKTMVRGLSRCGRRYFGAVRTVCWRDCLTDSKSWPVQNKTKRFMADYVTWDVDATKHFRAASLIVL